MLETTGNCDGLDFVGPFRSAYGVYIVEIEDYLAAHIPTIAAARDRVSTD